MTTPTDQQCPECGNPVSDIEYHDIVVPTGRCWNCGTGLKAEASKPDVERLYTGNSPTSMEHRAFSTRGLRERLGYTMSPKDWVRASAYDAKVAECAAKDARIAERNREVQYLIDTREAAYVERDELLADNTRLREALQAVMNYPDIRAYLGAQICRIADDALAPPPAPEVPRG